MLCKTRVRNLFLRGRRRVKNIMKGAYPATGDTIANRFRIRELKGGGATSLVYRAEDLASPGNDVALKMLLPGLAPSDVMLDCIKREIAAGIHSPFIAHSLGGFEDGYTFIIMKFVEGQCLADLLSLGPVSLPTTVHVGCCLCSAIEELTRKNMVSTDIKPANAIIEESTGNCVLIDLSSHEKCHQSPRLSGGTLPYAAPELLQKKTLSESTDIYSLSVMLTEVATGVSPIAGTSEQEMESNILAGNVNLAQAKGLNRKFAKLLQAGMNMNPKKRPTASEFRRELEVIVGIQAVTASLHFTDSQGQKKVVKINGDSLCLGRSLDTTNFFLSEVHARLTQDNGQIIIENSDSKNGVWVNNQRVQRASLRPGDSFCLANLKLTLLAG